MPAGIAVADTIDHLLIMPLAIEAERQIECSLGGAVVAVIVATMIHDAIARSAEVHVPVTATPPLV